MTTPRAGLAGTVVALMVLASACGSEVLHAEQILSATESTIYQQTGGVVSRVDCPRIAATPQVGQRIRCHVALKSGDRVEVETVPTNGVGTVQVRIQALLVRLMEQQIAAKLGDRARVTCPPKKPNDPGQVFTCTVTQPRSTPGTIQVQQRDHNGNASWDVVSGLEPRKSRRSGSR